MAEQQVTWNQPRRFETIIEISGGQATEVPIEIFVSSGTISLETHNDYWPSWLSISDVTESQVDGGTIVTARLTGTAPITGNFEAILRARHEGQSSDRTFYFVQETAAPASLGWVLDPSWTVSDGIVVLPSVREGDEYLLSLTSTGPAQRLYLLSEDIDGILGDEEQVGLPPGIRLDGSTGVLSGVPEEVTADTVYRFLVTLTDGTTQLPQEFSLTVTDASIDVPRWYTPPGSLGILLGGQTVEVMLDARNSFGKPVSFSLEQGSLPEGLSLSTAGVISGTATPVSSNRTWEFSVRAQTVGDSEYRVRNFSLTVSSVSVEGVIEWQTPEGDIGTTIEEQKADLHVRAFLRDQPDVEIHYVVGTPDDPPTLPVTTQEEQHGLPAGLRLIECDNTGLISGRAHLGTSGIYEIAVITYAGSPDDPTHASAVRTFTIDVQSHYQDEVVDIHLALPGYSRRKWKQWLTDAPIEEALLYRRCDAEFGTEIEPLSFLAGGLDVPGGFVVPYMGPHHRRFSIRLGEPEIAVVRGTDGRRKYEIIYLPALGSNADTLVEEPPFPASMLLLRKELLEQAPQDDAGEMIPPWMQQQQIKRNGKTHIGYQAAFIAAYVKPFTARVILDRWRHLGVFSTMTGHEAEIDRYVVEEIRQGGLSQRRIRTVLFPYETVSGTGYNVPTRPPVSSTISWTVKPRRGDLVILKTGEFRSVKIAMMADLSVTPQLGTLTVSGQPAQAWQFVQPAAASVDVAGQPPLVQQQKFLSPTLALSLVGSEPILATLVERITAPAPADLDISTIAPDTQTSMTIRVSEALLTLVGELSGSMTNLVSVPTSASLSIETEPSTIEASNTAVTLSPPSRAIRLLRFASVSTMAELIINISATEALISLDEETPLLSEISLSEASQPALIEMAGMVPKMVGYETVAPSAVALTLQGDAPSLLYELILPIESADLTISAGPATMILTRNVEPGVSELTLEEQLPAVARSMVIVSNSVGINLNGQTPDLGMSSASTPDAAIVTIHTDAAASTANLATSAPAAGISLDGQTPDLGMPSTSAPDAAVVAIHTDAAASTANLETSPPAAEIGLETSIPALTAQVDPDFSNVQLLLHFDGSNGDTISTDSSNAARPLTFHGNAQLDTAIQRFGSASLYLDGGSSYVSTPDAAELSVANASDMTLECFVRASNLTKTLMAILNKRDSAQAEEFSVYLRSTGEVLFSAYSGGSPVATIETVGAAIATDTWYHVAVVRLSGQWTLYVDGAAFGSANESATPASNGSDFKIGFDGYNTERGFDGRIDEVRVTSGVARYTQNFTPPTEAFPDS